MPASRRILLRAVAPLLGLGAAGCTSREGATDGEPTIGGTWVAASTEGIDDTNDPTGTPNPWISHEGETLVSVSVVGGFPQQVVLQAACRAEAVTVAPGASVNIDREADGEICSIRLLTDDEELYSGFVGRDQSFELTVRETGKVEERISVK